MSHTYVGSVNLPFVIKTENELSETEPAFKVILALKLADYITENGLSNIEVVEFDESIVQKKRYYYDFRSGEDNSLIVHFTASSDTPTQLLEGMAWEALADLTCSESGFYKDAYIHATWEYPNN